MLRSGLKRCAAAAAIAILVAACGSSYTKTDFIRAADGICLSTTRAVRLLPPPTFSGTARQQQASAAAYLSRLAPLVHAEARRLSVLNKPPGGRRERRLLANWLAAVRASAQSLEQLGSAMAHGDDATVIAADKALSELPVIRLASQYGARGCAGPGASYRAPG